MIERFGSQQNVYTSRQVDIVSKINKTLENTQGQQFEVKQSKDQLNEVIESINTLLQSPHTSLKFELHEKLNDYYVQVIDDETKEVIREIPSKKMLDMHAAMKEFIGVMIDEKI